MNRKNKKADLGKIGERSEILQIIKDYERMLELDEKFEKQKK